MKIFIRVSLLSILLALLLVVILAICIVRFQPPFIIAYESQFTRQNTELYLLDTNRRLPIRLTHSPTIAERQPIWSPDGESLTYATNENGNWDIFEIDINTRQTTPVVENDALDLNATWSPDGSSLAFTSTRDGNHEIYWLDTGQTSNIPTRLTRATGVDEEPMWSPDGRCLAFTSYRDTDREIFVLELKTGEQTNITHNFMHNEWGVSWSPDGQFITFTSTQDNTSWNIYRYDRLTQETVRITDIEADIARAIWTPDGKNLIAEIYDSASTRSLYLLPYDQIEVLTVKNLRRLTFSNTDDRYAAPFPQQFPDSQAIIESDTCYLISQ